VAAVAAVVGSRAVVRESRVAVVGKAVVVSAVVGKAVVGKAVVDTMADDSGAVAGGTTV